MWLLCQPPINDLNVMTYTCHISAVHHLLSAQRETRCNRNPLSVAFLHWKGSSRLWLPQLISVPCSIQSPTRADFPRGQWARNSKRHLDLILHFTQEFCPLPFSVFFYVPWTFETCSGFKNTPSTLAEINIKTRRPPHKPRPRYTLVFRGVHSMLWFQNLQLLFTRV